MKRQLDQPTEFNHSEHVGAPWSLIALIAIFKSGLAAPTGFDSFVAACGLLYVVTLPRRSIATAPQPDTIATTHRQPLPIPFGAGSLS